MPTPLTDADKVLRNDTGKDIVEKLDDIAQALGVGVNADQINYNNTTSGLESENVQDAVDEVKEITDNLDNKLDGLTDIISTASGTIVTFNDGGDNIPVKSLVTGITAQQAGTGTPSPSNPLPITGFSSVNVVDCGKNILKPTTLETSTSNGVVFTMLSDGTIRANGKAEGGNAICNINNILSGDLYETLLPFDNVACIGSGCPSVNGCRISFARMNGSSFFDDTGSGVSFTISNLTPSINAYVRLQVDNGTTVNNAIFKPMIRRVTDSATYEPYNGTTTPVSLGQTIYGGTAELVNGNGIKTFDISDLGDLSWSYDSTNKRFVASLTGAKLNGSSRAYTNPNSKCTNYEVIFTDREYTYNEMVSGISSKNNVIWLYTASGDSYVNVKDTAYTDAPTFKTAMTGVKFVYELETSTVFTFTGANIPTLSGENNIYSNCGDVEVEYFNSKADWLADLIKAMSAT